MREETDLGAHWGLAQRGTERRAIWFGGPPGLERQGFPRSLEEKGRSWLPSMREVNGERGKVIFKMHNLKMYIFCGIWRIRT